MPFQSPYNEMIANKVNKINKKMLVRRKEPVSFLPDKDHNVVEGNYFNMGLPDNAGPITGRGRSVGAGLLKDVYNKGKFIYDEAKNFYKKPVSRGLHYASKIADHYGYGRSGGGVNKYADRIPYFPAGSTGELGMLGNGSSGGGIFGNVARGVGSVVDAFGLGKKKQPKQQKGAGIFGNVARGVGSVVDAFGLGKKRQPKQQKGAGIFGNVARGVGSVVDAFGLGKKRQPKQQKGAGIFGDVARGVGSVSDIFGLGKKKQPKQQKGGALFGDDIFGFGKKKQQKGAGKFDDFARGAFNVVRNLDTINNAFGLGKKRKKSVAHPEEFAMRDRVNNHGSYGGKRPNKRADLVKKIMKERGCNMVQASSIIKSEGLYKP
jgi:hypothetical protein